MQMKLVCFISIFI